MKLNISNLLTLARIIVIPIIVLCIYMNSPFYGWAAFILFCIASITDYFDGYIARIRNEVTNFGTFLDPIADKLLVAAVILILAILETGTLTLIFARYSLRPDTAISLSKIIRAGIVSQSAIISFDVNINITAATNNLSAMGSRKVPKFVTSFLIRAM